MWGKPLSIPNMMELLLAFLALFNFSPDKSGQPIDINSDLYSNIRCNDSYEVLGGDDYLLSLKALGDPNSKEDIIVTDQVDPQFEK